MYIKKIDHIVITTAKPKECIAFYAKLGFEVSENGNRYELFAGDFKINVHTMGKELSPYAKNVTPGSADLCFEINGDINKFKDELMKLGIVIEPGLGVVARVGVRGNMRSVYLRDPDGNLIEICSYLF